MPVNNPPTWATLLSKPTTIAGFGITDHSWATLLSKPTTIAGFGITDAVKTDLGAGSHPVGAILSGSFGTTGGTITPGTTAGGSTINFIAPEGTQNLSAGTWRNIGLQSAEYLTHGTTAFQRIA